MTINTVTHKSERAPSRTDTAQCAASRQVAHARTRSVLASIRTRGPATTPGLTVIVTRPHAAGPAPSLVSEDAEKLGRPVIAPPEAIEQLERETEVQWRRIERRLARLSRRANRAHQRHLAALDAAEAAEREALGIAF